MTIVQITEIIAGNFSESGYFDVDIDSVIAENGSR